MTYEEALEMIEEEFETIYNAPRCKVLRTGMTYNGANGFCVSVYDSDDGVIITDLGQTKEIFDEVTVEEWTALCEEHGFKFVHWRIVREFKGMQDVYDFIEFLDLVSTKYWDED